MLNLSLNKRIYNYSFAYKDVDYNAEIVVDYYSKTTEGKIYYAKSGNLVTDALAPRIDISHGDLLQGTLDAHFGIYKTLFD